MIMMSFQMPSMAGVKHWTCLGAGANRRESGAKEFTDNVQANSYKDAFSWHTAEGPLTSSYALSQRLPVLPQFWKGHSSIPMVVSPIVFPSSSAPDVRQLVAQNLLQGQPLYPSSSRNNMYI